MSSYGAATPQPAAIITYRHGENLVYVKPVQDYEVTPPISPTRFSIDRVTPTIQEALNIAQKEFPEKLSHVSRDRIIFMITATMNGTRRPVRISDSAWPAIVTRLVRGEIVGIEVAEPRKLSAEAPPRYLEVPDAKDATDSRLSRSSPSSRSNSRQSSPVGRRKRSISRTWFGVATTRSS
jgi:hypothetical protein